MTLADKLLKEDSFDGYDDDEAEGSCNYLADAQDVIEVLKKHSPQKALAAFRASTEKMREVCNVIDGLDGDADGDYCDKEIAKFTGEDALGVGISGDQPDHWMAWMNQHGIEIPSDPLVQEIITAQANGTLTYDAIEPAYINTVENVLTANESPAHAAANYDSMWDLDVIPHKKLPEVKRLSLLWKQISTESQEELIDYIGGGLELKDCEATPQEKKVAQQIKKKALTFKAFKAKRGSGDGYTAICSFLAQQTETDDYGWADDYESPYHENVKRFTELFT